MGMSTLLLNKDIVKDLLKMPGVIKVVEDAFIALGQHRATMPPKAYLVVEHGDFGAIQLIQMTLDTYSHVAPGIQEAAAERFDKILNPRKSTIGR